MWWVQPAFVFAKNFKKPLLIGASVVAIAGASFVGGAQHATRKFEANQSKQTEKVIEKIVTEYVERDAEERVVYLRDLEATRKLEAERDRLRIENQQLQGQIYEAIPIQDGHYGTFIPVGAVRLLDRAADPAGAASAELPATALDETDFAPSNVNWRDLASYTVRIAGQYNDVAKQCNALIEWNEQNIARSPVQ